MQTVLATTAYPNERGGVPGDVLVYPCPNCSRTHFTLLHQGEDAALTYPPCGSGGATGQKHQALEVLPPLPIHRLDAPPIDVWAEQFEAERVRARGGRPVKAEVAVSDAS